MNVKFSKCEEATLCHGSCFPTYIKFLDVSINEVQLLDVFFIIYFAFFFASRMVLSQIKFYVILFLKK